MAIDPYIGCNFSIPTQDCTLETCCLAQSHFLYRPSYDGNVFFAIFFGVMILPQLGLGIHYHTWGFSIGMICGLVLECIGYVARVAIHNNPFASNPFLIYLICLTIAPVFLTAAIYLCLTRIIGLYGQNLSRFQPKTIAIAFMASDFLSLVLQAIGGAIADTANTHATAQVGADIMVAGLVLQAVSLTVFLVVVADFAWQCHRGVLDMHHQKQRIRNGILFKIFMASLLFATILVLIRSIFRAAELWQGFRGSIWNNEVDFMVLDGAMIATATLCLTALHPGPSFGDQWHASNWSFKTSRVKSESETVLSDMQTKHTPNE